MLGEGHGGLYKSQHWKKEESEKLRGDGDQINFIYLRFERCQIVGFGKGEGKTFHKLLALGINDDL